MPTSSQAAFPRRLAEEFVQGYNGFTIESLRKPHAENCEHHMLPANLNRPARTNTDYEKFFAGSKENMRDFRMTPHRFVNDPDEKTIAVYATGTATTRGGPYDNSYVFFLTCDCEKEKIVRVDESVDSKFSEEFFAKTQVY